ncbi:aldo/keto reductase [Bacillus sonorensis]|uniref:Pyridoxine 4-dehydrogenase n=1 Tax=Bacillus sonorensis TaxID=119858 RepID=A0ABM6LHR1_9BACI|nr:aldo/keto reductase [Bacillus sonorensis]ASB88863.1 Pyridoxine 4-dehydrogenase [Bacillus sonorensis]
MKKRKLGRLEVSSIGLGCMSMSEFYGEADESEAISAVYQALDSGVNFLIQPIYTAWGKMKSC